MNRVKRVFLLLALIGITIPSSSFALGLNVPLPVAPVSVSVPTPIISTPVTTVPVGNSGTGQSNTVSLPGVLPGVLNTTVSLPGVTTGNVSIGSTPGQNATSDQLLNTGIVSDALWLPSSPAVSVSYTRNSGDPEKDGSQLISVNDVSALGSALVYHTYSEVKDWSGYSKIGFWILPSAFCNPGDISLILSPFKNLATSTNNVIFSLPALPANQWTFVSFDLDAWSTIHNIFSYGFKIAPNKLFSFNIRPFELGPGILNHFKIQPDGTGKDIFRIIAEDKNDLPLNFGKNLYSGPKLLTFQRDPASITANLAPVAQAKATVSFDRGVSELVSLDAIAPGIGLDDIDLTDGAINTDLGDFTYNLAGQSNGLTQDTVSPKMSMVEVSPNPVNVGKPVLVTFTAMDSDGNQLPVSNLSVVATITGANAQTLPLGYTSDGVYEGVYVALKAGADQITVKADGTAIGSDGDGTNDGTFHLNIISTTGVPGIPTGGPGGGGTYFGGSGAGASSVAAGGTTCSAYLLKFIKRGANNDPAEVTKLQTFLRDREGMSAVKVTGVYDAVTFNAVKAFQLKYVKDVLNPWKTAVPTGYVYIRTVQKINDIYCKGSTPQIVKAAPASSGSCPLFTSTASLGSSGEDVIAIQKFLVNQKLMDSPASWGYYGALTVEAVKKFQKKYAADILAPVNQKNGTGRWLSMSIKKANQLSGCAQ